MISLKFMQRNKRLYTFASALALITVVDNIVEGVASVFFGLEDGSMALGVIKNPKWYTKEFC